MKFEIDEQYLITCFQELVSVPSPVSYSVQLTPVLERYAADFGRTITYDRRGTAYMALDGEDHPPLGPLRHPWSHGARH